MCANMRYELYKPHQWIYTVGLLSFLSWGGWSERPSKCSESANHVRLPGQMNRLVALQERLWKSGFKHLKKACAAWSVGGTVTVQYAFHVLKHEHINLEYYLH